MSGWRAAAVTLALVAAGCALSGCEFRRIVINDPIRPEDVAFIRPGVTTMSDIVTHLGVPDEIEGTEERAVFRYRFRDAKIFRVDFGKLLRFWSPVTPDMILGRGNLGTDVLQVAFDPHWIVQEHAFAKQARSAR
ncbi:MAG: hypothetical protein HY581_09850, partial [Nitrospirae bacterium]|nr:hypothetical protein [Nitrospirota bacterium]